MSSEDGRITDRNV